VGEKVRPHKEFERAPQKSVKWDRDKGSRAAQLYVVSGNTLDKIESFWPEAYPHLKLFEERLKFFTEVHNKKMYSIPFMIENTLVLGPQFADQWADGWKSARFRFMGMEYATEPDPITLEVPGDTYDELFHPGFLPFWDTEDPGDYQYMFGDKPECDAEFLERVRDKAAHFSAKLLKDEDLWSDPPPEVLYRPVGTSGFTGESKEPEWEIEFDNPFDDYEEDALITVRSLAPKGPHETRDIGIMKPQSMRKHRRIMYHLQAACKRIKGCAYSKTVNQIREINKVIGESSNFFYMRDYTKSGMTIPHAIIRAVLEGFYERRPDLAAAGPKFFENQLFYIPDEKGELHARRPITGAPLGLFVEGYTLFQYILHDLNCEDIGERSRNSLFSATNDDMVVGFRNRKAASRYMEVDQANNARAGMFYKDTKSGLTTDQFVYCEEYCKKGLIQSKTSLFSMAMLSAKFATNVLQAKEYTYSIWMSAGYWREPVQQAFQVVIDSWAGCHEFDPDEFTWPYIFGGWLPCIQGGLDISHEWYAQNPDFRLDCAYWASRLRLPKRGKLSSRPHLTLGRKLGVTLLRDPGPCEDWVDLVPLFGNRKTLEKHFSRRALNPVENAKEYKTLLKLRRDVYERRLSGGIAPRDVLEGYLDRHPGARIQAWLPGLVLSEGVTRVIKPFNGLGKEPLQEWLLYLSKKGVVSLDHYPEQKYIPGTLMRLLGYGINQAMNYPYLPVPDCAIGWKVLNSNFLGYLEFFERTHMTIVTYGEDDEVIPETELWHLVPEETSLRVLLRWWPMRRQVPPETPNLMSVHYLAAYVKMWNKTQSGAEEVDPPPATSESSDDKVWTLSLAEYLMGLYRDLHPETGPEMLAEIENRIQRRPGITVEAASLEDRPKLRDDFEDPFGQSRWSPKITEEGLPVSDDEESLPFDPWDALDSYS
jgi:hypothetical protein